jgi:hypothetical protein
MSGLTVERMRRILLQRPPSFGADRYLHQQQQPTVRASRAKHHGRRTIMSEITEAPAVAFVRAHMEAYTNGDLETARANVADTVQCYTNETHLDGIGPYMEGLARFMAVLEPGSLRVLAARGDQQKAIVMTEHTVGGQPFPSARTFELDDTGKIKAERVVFFGPSA